MSELKVDSIKPSTAATVSIPQLDTSSIVIESRVKAWGNFNGSTSSINWGENVMGITNGGTGRQTVNLSIVLPNTNYILMGMAGTTSTITQDLGVYNNEETLNTTTSFILNTVLNGALADTDRSNFAVVMNP